MSTKTTVTLSSTELEMLNIQREKAALKKKEDLLKQEEKRLKEINNAKSQIQKLLSDNKKYVASTLAFLGAFEEEFPGEFKLIKVDGDIITVKKYDFVYDEETQERKKDKDGHYIEDVYFEERVKLQQFEIRYKNLKEPHILVKEHIVDSGHSIYSKKSHGFKMVTKGVDSWKERNKYFTNVKSIREKILEKLDSDNNQKEQERIHKAGIPWVIKAVKEKYDSTLLKEVKEDYHNVRAEFKNGLVVHFHYKYDEGKYELDIMEIKHGYKLKDEDIVDALMKLKKKPEKE